MLKLINAIAYLSLIVLTGSAALYLTGMMPLNRVKSCMLAATVVWFAAPLIRKAWSGSWKMSGRPGPCAEEPVQQ